MKLLVFLIDGRIYECHHVTFINMKINKELTLPLAILTNDNFEEVKTVLVREILSIQYEEEK